MISYAQAVYEVARKEALQHLRTKRLIILGAILLASLVLVTIIVPFAIFPGEFLREIGDETGLAVANFLFLFFLNAPVIGGVFLLELLALVLTADGVVSEWQRKTVFLVLSRPVPRSAFVLGKFFGSAIPLVVMFSIVFILDYALLAALTGGVGAEAVGRFLATLGLLALGTAAFAALGLLFSTLMRSSTPAFTLSLVAAILVFPLVSNIGDFTYAADGIGGDDPRDEDAWRYDWSHYATPASAINTAPGVLTGEEELDFTLNFLFPQFSPQRVPLAVGASLAWTALFVALAVLAVARRDFE